MSINTKDLHVSTCEPLQPPEQLIEQLPASEAALTTIVAGRAEIRAALAGSDKRQLVIVGPCSIHDGDAALDYAQRLLAVKRRVSERLIVVMRVYFEKPRTTVGWKGLISDPQLDGSDDLDAGLRAARAMLLEINELGLPCATEFLDPIVPQYIADLVAWAAIGARTTESQTHRQMASGLSMPVGFKNATDGDMQIAINAMASAGHSHSFLGIDMAGRTAVVRTTGNPDAHLVLRGGGGKSNYSSAHIAFAKELLSDGERRRLLIDCSHDNSGKDYRKQPDVFDSVLKSVLAGEHAVLGTMLESNIVAGNQKLGDELVYGKSITDACIDWDTTEQLLVEAHQRLGQTR